MIKILLAEWLGSTGRGTEVGSHRRYSKVALSVKLVNCTCNSLAYVYVAIAQTSEPAGASLSKNTVYHYFCEHQRNIHVF